MNIFAPLKSYLVSLRKPQGRKILRYQLLAQSAEGAVKIARGCLRAPKAELVSVEKLPTTSRLRRINKERDLTNVGLLNMALVATTFGASQPKPRRRRKPAMA
jgi:hypothetical protein